MDLTLIPASDLAAELGRRAAGREKTMSAAAIQQRRNAAKKPRMSGKSKTNPKRNRIRSVEHESGSITSNNFRPS